MTPESRQFLAYVAAQPKGRVGCAQTEWPRAFSLAREALAGGLVKERRFDFQPGFQITAAGRAYLAGEAPDA